MDPKAREKLLDQIQNDLKNLSLESKKSKALQGLREATEEAIVKVRVVTGGRKAHNQDHYLIVIPRRSELPGHLR